MKRTLTTIILLTALTTARAQQSGTVRYSETMKMDIKMEGQDDELMKMIPREQKLERVLYFTPEAAVYLNAVKGEEKEKEYNEESGGIRIKMDVPDEQFYTDIPGHAMVQQRDFMGRKFLVESRTDEGKWKLTGNQSTILDYRCQEAVMQDGERTVIAWFTPEIPVSVGPHRFGGLPGLILKLDIDSGTTVMEATYVELKPVDMSRIKKPKNGKKMSQQEFQAMMAEKRKEMGNGGNNVMIRIRR